MRKILIFIFCSYAFLTYAQTTVKIALIHDAKVELGILKELEQNTKFEIRQLLQHRFDLDFYDLYGNQGIATIQSNIEEAYKNYDIVITLGIIGSQLISKRGAFPKPTIAAVISDSDLSGLNKTPAGTSGVSNFVFIESPFDVARDLRTLYAVQAFENLAIVYENELIFGGNNLLEGLIEKNLGDRNVATSFYNIDDLISGNALLKEEIDAVYVLPLLNKNAGVNIKLLFDKINNEKLPSMALFGENYIESGALIAYETNQNLNLIPRRIALNTLKVVEGLNAQEIPVVIETYNDNLLINMAVAREIGIYPNFDLMAKATLINLEDNSTDRKLTLQSAIAESLKSNLDLQLSQLDVGIAETEVGIAKADQLPQLDISTSLAISDELTALSYQGAQGQVNWIGSANVSQVIFSEPLLANIAIQKLLKKGEKLEVQQTQMDLIVDVAEAYLNILQAQSNLRIQQKNVEVTKENYSISNSKNAIGYEGAADLHRWEAELASKNINLNSAFATVKQAKFRLNQLLNRPINEPFSVNDETLENQLLLVTDGSLDQMTDYGMVEKFTNFIVDFAKDKLPTLDLIENNIDVQERLQLSRQRAFYMPSVALSGSTNRVLGKYKIPDIFEPTENAMTWNIGLGVSYPILQGNLRKEQLEQSHLQIDQLNFTKKNIQNQLELLIRSNMETVYVSFSRMDLSREAADAASKNFKIIQDAYNQGQANITTLIDAQNNTLQSELNATNAVYQFILDFLILERSIGFFYFLASEEERKDFFQRANEYLIRK